MTWALHVANLLILSSFLMRNILVLRFLSITGGVFFATYFLSQSPPMTAPVKWNILFAIVNLTQIVRLLRANRKVPLCLEETFIKDTIFHSLRALEIKSVFQLATVQSVSSTGTLKLANDEFGIVLNGLLRCSISNVTFQQGDMLGIHGYLGRPTEISTFGVESDVTLLKWNVSELRAWCEETGERKTMILSAVSQKLLSQNSAA